MFSCEIAGRVRQLEEEVFVATKDKEGLEEVVEKSAIEVGLRRASLSPPAVSAPSS